MQTIRYYTRESYGNVHCYPLDHVKNIRQLTGRKTLIAADVTALRGMGFKFERVLQPEAATI